MDIKGALTVERDQFIAWTEGILLDRNEEGEVLIVNELACSRAEKAMEQGETVYLTQDGKIVTKMHLAPEGFIEEHI